MHGGLELCRDLVPKLAQGARESVALVVCPPTPYLSTVSALTRGTSLSCGVQNVSQFKSGAYTGEISSAMINEFGVQFAIIGHSERRALFGETNEIVVAKTHACLESGITPIVCVGETERERSMGATERVVAQQVDALLGALTRDAIAKCVLAYEPVWAIGTGRTATPDQAQEVHHFIRQRLVSSAAQWGRDVSILYGGSVKSTNSRDLFAMPDIDGGLVGGASLVTSEFLSIYQSALKVVLQ